MKPIRAKEPELLRTRPGFAFVFLYRQGWWLGPVVVVLLIHAAMARLWTDDPAPWLTWVAVAWFVLGLAYRIAAWLFRSYVISERRIVVRAGVLARIAAEVPRRRIQHTVLSQSFIERLLSLGTVGVSTADGPAVNLLMVPQPQAVLDLLRERARPMPPVIGLAGGIGAGKSEVARILKGLGCLVIDSDKEAKEALDRPEVRDQLVKWWGGSVVGPDGRIDRKTVAGIIFKSDKDRAALEALIHPLVRARREELKKSGAAAGAEAVVMDAPLLFEAGVDRECDVVVFVEADRGTRLARILATRGWDEAEFTRRERAQLPLEEKRKRSSLVVVNDGTAPELAQQVRAALDRVLKG